MLSKKKIFFNEYEYAFFMGYIISESIALYDLIDPYALEC